MIIFLHNASSVLFLVFSVFSRGASSPAARAAASPTTAVTPDSGLRTHCADYPVDKEESLEDPAAARQDLSVSLISPQTALLPSATGPAAASQ